MRKSLVFGGTSTGLLASFSPSDINQYSCWKTLQMSFEWADPTLLEVLPKSGMTVNGQLFKLQILAHHTEERAGFVLPTPTAVDATVGAVLNENTEIIFTQSGNPRKVSNQGISGSVGLARYVRIMLPTPTVNEAKNNPSGASQWDRCGSLNVEAAKMEGLDKTTGKDFRLNPLFVEEMMGFPIGWTDLEHSETQSSHSAPNGLDNKS